MLINAIAKLHKNDNAFLFTQIQAMDIYILRDRINTHEKLKELASKRLQRFYDLWLTKADPNSDLELYQKIIKPIRLTSTYAKFTVFDFKFKLKAAIYPSQKLILLRTYFLKESPQNSSKLKSIPLPQFDLFMDEFSNVKHNDLAITGNFNKEYVDLLIDYYEENNLLE